MAHHEHHEELIEGFVKQFAPVFDHSTQRVYVYLDDQHKACNKRFASMLGYTIAEWSAVTDAFLNIFLADESQELVATTYHATMNYFKASSIPVTWKTKAGKLIKSTVIIVPVVYEGHPMALHFIQET